MTNRFSRRTAIVRSAQAAAALAGGASLAAGQQPAALAQVAQAAGPQAAPGDKSKLVIGIATLGFPDYTNADLARELAASGIKVVQLFLSQKDSRFWIYNSRSDISSLTADRCKAIAEAYRSAGVSIHSIGVYTNLIHPDPAERKANLAYFDAMMAIGGHMGVRTFISEAGHYTDPKGPEPHVPLHFQDAVWPLMVAMRGLAFTRACPRSTRAARVAVNALVSVPSDS